MMERVPLGESAGFNAFTRLRLFDFSLSTGRWGHLERGSPATTVEYMTYIWLVIVQCEQASNKQLIKAEAWVHKDLG